MRAALAAMLLLSGCSEYNLSAELGASSEGQDPPADDPVFDDPVDPPADDIPEVIDPEPELPSCAETVMADWPWWGSQPFEEPEDPTDWSGRPFYDVDFDMVDFSTVVLPDQGHTPPGTDRVYRATFDLWGEPPALFLSMQSDDGLAFWVNGTLVGEWGGAWQEEGCVNDDSNCLEYVYVAPVDISPLLHEGTNVVAPRVSNAV